MADPRQFLCLLLLTAVAASLTGCGQAAGRRKAVFGTISGAEGRSGLISFIPENDGPATRVKVTDGEYVFDESNGPLPGQYEVVVQLEKPSTQIDETILVKGVAVPAEQISSEDPPLETQYERQSLKVAVPDDGSLKLDLNLPVSAEAALDDRDLKNEMSAALI
ncbi:MAG: hypothetical protein H8E37_04975 [Planctomycetes bacterium]|nr:hypothetical protein [Planctomycetota bacterium]